MKKNNMLRIASVLLVAVLLSTCAVSGVFAFYQTKGATTDDARVAKWGVKIADEGADMFGEAYGAGDAIVTDKVTYADSITVDSDVKVVAPGTKGGLAALTITGTPEVDVKVTYTADLTLTDWTVKGDNPETTDVTETDYEFFYCPIVITVKSTTGNGTTEKVFKGTAYTSNTDFEEAVEGAIVGLTADYQTNTDLSTVVADDVQVSWAWAYGSEHVNDTYLGDQAAAGNAATIKLVTTTTITQND